MMRATGFHRWLLAVGLVTGVSPAVSSAQTDTIPPDSVRYVGGLMVRVARPALTTGGSSAVVIALDSMAHPPAPSLEQVIRSMPLIQIRTNSRGEAQPALRGSDDRQIAILMDGVPLTLGWDHRTDMSIVPLTAARNITLVRGLSSVLYGPNTLGGVIEVDIARAGPRITRIDPLSIGFSLDETGGTNFSASGAKLFDGELSQWVVRGGAGFQDRPGLRVPNGVIDDPSIRARFLADDNLRLNSDTRRVDGFLTARYRGDGSWASLSASGYQVERGVPPEAHQDKPRLWRYPDQRRVIAAVAAGTGQIRTSRGTGDLEASIGLDFGSTRIDQYSTAAYELVEGREDAADRVLTARVLGEHTLGEKADLRTSATYADISRDQVLTPGGASVFRQRLWSLGVESEWRLGAHGETGLTLGVALDGADTPESGDKPPLGRLSDYGFRIGMTSLVSDGVLLHGGISRRSRFPSLRELYSGALGRFEVNPSLRPETLLGVEAGFTVGKRRGELQVVGFHNRLRNGIVRTSVTGNDGVRRFQRINQDQVRSTGLELLAVGALGSATVTGDLTLQTVRGVDETGAEVDLEYEPSIAGKLGIDIALPADVRGSSDLRFMGEQRCENPEAGGLQPLAASATIDLSLRRLFVARGGGPLSRIDATASVRNVADAAVFDQCGLPQPGRTFQIQFRLW